MKIEGRGLRRGLLEMAATLLPTIEDQPPIQLGHRLKPGVPGRPAWVAGAAAQAVDAHCADAAEVLVCGGGANAGLPCASDKHCNYCVGGTFDGLPCDPAMSSACTK